MRFQGTLLKEEVMILVQLMVSFRDVVVHVKVCEVAHTLVKNA